MESTKFKFQYFLCVYALVQVLGKPGFMSCPQLAYLQLVTHTRQILLNIIKVQLGSLHPEKQPASILMVYLFWRISMMRYQWSGPIITLSLCCFFKSTSVLNIKMSLHISGYRNLLSGVMVVVIVLHFRWS